jgi:L-cysteine/cystine lyase
MDVQKLRNEIPVLANLTYMNTGWSGPPPRRAAEAMKARTDLELERGPTTADVYESGRIVQADAREAAARLLNAPLESVLVTRNTTEGLNIVMSGLDWREGDEIITCNLEHGSVLVPTLMLGERCGVKAEVAMLDPHDSKETVLQKFEDAFTPNTRMVFVSHVEYSTGMRMPVEELCRMAHDHGAMIMLDGAQTGGHIKLDTTAQSFDFYSIPGQKWVLGYEGVGALYIRHDLIPQVHPAHTGGRALVPPVTPDHIEPNPTVMEKFVGGSSSVPLQAAFLEAARFIESIGVENIEVRDLELAEGLKAKLRRLSGVTVLSPEDPGLSAGLVSFAVEGWEPRAVVEHLWSNHRIVVRQVQYPAAVRASLHFFNTEDEVEQLAEAVKALAL